MLAGPLQGDLGRLDALKFTLDRVDQIEGQAGLLNKGKVSIPTEDFEELKDMAKKHLVSGYKVEKLTKDYSSLKNDFDKVYHSRESTRSNNFELRRKLGEVESNLKTINKFLGATNQVSTAVEFAHTIKQAKRSNDMELWAIIIQLQSCSERGKAKVLPGAITWVVINWTNKIRL